MRERDRITALERRVATLEKGDCPARMEFPTPPGDGWRWVQLGEVLVDGDEFLPWGFPRASEWRPITHVVGEPCQEIYAYRRRIDAKSNHDAAPAARARTDSATGEPSGGHGSGWTHKPVTRSVLGTGDTQAPVAWAVMLADGERIYGVYAIEEEAKAIDEAVTGNHGVVPLYRSPTLTDEEREALEWAAAEAKRIADAAWFFDASLERRWVALRLLARRLG